MTTTARSIAPRSTDLTPVSELGTYEIVRRLPVTTWSLRPTPSLPSIPFGHASAHALLALGQLSGWIAATPWTGAVAHRLGARYALASSPPPPRVTTAWLGVASDAHASVASVPPPPAWLPSILAGWKAATTPDANSTDARADFALRSASWTLWLFATTQPFGSSSDAVASSHAARFLALAAGLPTPIVAGAAHDAAQQKSVQKLLVNAQSLASFARWHDAWLACVASECEARLQSLRRFGEARAHILAVASEMRAPNHCVALAHALATNPIVTVAEAAAHMQLTFRAAQAIVDKFVAEAVLREITGRRRDRRYQCDALSDQVLFSEPPVAETPC